MIINELAQLRTTNLEESTRICTETMGFTFEFRFQDCYAVIRDGLEVFHLKLVDDPDPSIEFVPDGEHFHLYFESDDVGVEANAPKKKGVRLRQDVHITEWGTKQIILEDDQGHTLNIAQRVVGPPGDGDRTRH